MAGNLIYLRRRIKSVKNTQKLTKAMKTVAAAKLRRANGRTEKPRAAPRQDRLFGCCSRPAGHDRPGGRQPLLKAREQGEVLLVVVASDKGLCGAFNSHVSSRARAATASWLRAAKRFPWSPWAPRPAAISANATWDQKPQAYNGLISRLHFADAESLAAGLQDVYTCTEDVTASGIRFPPNSSRLRGSNSRCAACSRSTGRLDERSDDEEQERISSSPVPRPFSRRCCRATSRRRLPDVAAVHGRRAGRAHGGHGPGHAQRQRHDPFS